MDSISILTFLSKITVYPLCCIVWDQALHCRVVVKGSRQVLSLLPWESLFSGPCGAYKASAPHLPPPWSSAWTSPTHPQASFPGLVFNLPHHHSFTEDHWREADLDQCLQTWSWLWPPSASQPGLLRGQSAPTALWCPLHFYLSPSNSSLS